MVEVIKHMQEKLGGDQRAMMRQWWRGFMWACWLYLLPHRFLLAWRYNWQQRRTVMVLTWLLPIPLVLCVLLPLTIYGFIHLHTERPVSNALVPRGRLIAGMRVGKGQCKPPAKFLWEVQYQQGQGQLSQSCTIVPVAG